MKNKVLFSLLILISGLFVNACSSLDIGYKETTPDEMYASTAEFLSAAFGHYKQPDNTEVIARQPRDGSLITFSGKVEDFDIRSDNVIDKEKINIKYRLAMDISRSNSRVAINLGEYNKDFKNFLVVVDQPFEIIAFQSINQFIARALEVNKVKGETFTFSGKIIHVEYPYPYSPNGGGLQEGYFTLTQGLGRIYSKSQTFKNLVADLNAQNYKPIFLDNSLRALVLEEIRFSIRTSAPNQSIDEVESRTKRDEHLLSFLNKTEKYPIRLKFEIYEMGNTKFN